MDTGKLVKFESMPVQGQYDQQALIELLQRLACIPGLADRLVRCLDRFPEVERYMVSFEDRCRSTVSRCESLEMLCRNFLCPGNVNFSQRTMDESRTAT